MLCICSVHILEREKFRVLLNLVCSNCSIVVTPMFAFANLLPLEAGVASVLCFLPCSLPVGHWFLIMCWHSLPLPPRPQVHSYAFHRNTHQSCEGWFSEGYRACFLLYTATDNDFKVQWHFRNHFSQHKILSTLDIYFGWGFLMFLESEFSSATSSFVFFITVDLLADVAFKYRNSHFLICTCASYDKMYDSTSSDVCTFVLMYVSAW